MNRLKLLFKKYLGKYILFFTIQVSIFICIFLYLLKQNVNNDVLVYERSHTLDGNVVMKNESNPIFINLSSSTDFVAGNCFFKEQNKLMLLYYSKYEDSTAIFLAESSDGINFKNTYEAPILIPGDRGQWDSGGVSVFPNCIVKKYDGTYFMYYSGSLADAGDIYHSGQIGLATSANLKDWTKHNSNPILGPSEIGWDSWGVFEPSIHFSGNDYGVKDAYKMWYGGSNDQLRFKIGYAESSDGINWKKHFASPVISYSSTDNQFDSYSVEVHSVRKIHGKFIMLYEAIETEFPSPFAVGIAYSSDGINWKKSKHSPVLSQGMVGDWDQMGIYHPSLVDFLGRTYIYYVGLDYAFEHRIGVAEINPIIFFSESQDIIQ